MTIRNKVNKGVVNADMRRYFYIFIISFSISLPPFFLFLPDDASAQSYRERRLLVKRYVLYGSLELSYERRWFQGETRPTATDFIQSYNLGVKGFVIDPRLVNFDISGLLTRSSRKNLGESYTLIGTNVFISLLETIPPRWLNASKFIPNPIMLRYSNYSSYYDYTNYGVSLRYSMAGQAGSERKRVKGRIPFPDTFFDYDRYDYETEDYKSVIDTYSLRSQLRGKRYDYKFLYEYLNQTGTTEFKRNTIELQPNYRFYNPETRRLLDITNLLRWEEINDRRYLDLRSYVSWLKPIGKDTLSVSGGLDYSTTSNAETTATYNASATGLYTKVISPRLTNTATLSLGFGKTEERTTHFERLGDTVSVDISRVFRGSGSVFLGNNYNGVEYGTDVYLYTKTRIRASAGYSFASLSLDEGSTLTHRFILNASGPIISNLSFNTNADYVVKDISESDNPYSEDTLLYSANLFWRFAKTSVTAGGTHTQTTKKNGETVESKLTSLQGNLSRILTRRTFLNIYSTWTKDLNDKMTLEVRPRLRWSTRQAFVDVEYNYRGTSEPDSPAFVEHRFFVRFIRRFSHVF